MQYRHHGGCDRRGVLPRGSYSERGAALLFALLAVLITAMAVGAVATLCTQDNSLANVQADSAAALDTAEAALHWELSKMSRAESDSSITVDQVSSPFHGGAASMAALWGGSGFGGSTMPIAGSATVYVRHPDPNLPYKDWPRPWDFVIFASGTVHSATRSLIASGTAVGLGDTFALYGIDSLQLTGSGTVRLAGAIGSAGNCTVTAPVTGGATTTVVFDGSGGWQGAADPDLPRWVSSGIACMFPTVNAVAGRAATQIAGVNVSPSTAIAYFGNHNDNNTQMLAKYTDGSTLPIPYTEGSGPVLDSTVYQSANSVPGRTLDAIQIRGSTVQRNGVPIGSNFYFERFDIPSGQKLEVVNDAASGHGPVRIWLGPAQRAPSGALFGFEDGSILHVTDYALGSTASANNLKIYNATGATFTIGSATGRDGLGLQGSPANWNNGNSGLFMQVYAYNSDGSNYGTIRVSGSAVVRGPLIADTVRKEGSGTLDAALPSGASERDWLRWVLYYRLRGQWVETNTSGTQIDALRGMW